MIKVCSKLGTGENFFDLIKGTFKKSTDKLTINDERLNAFHLKSETRQVSPLLTRLVDVGLTFEPVQSGSEKTHK